MNTTIVALVFSLSYILLIFFVLSFYFELQELRKNNKFLKERLSYESLMKKRHRKKEKAFRRENKELNIKYRELCYLYNWLHKHTKDFLTCKWTLKSFEKNFKTKFKIWNMK